MNLYKNKWISYLIWKYIIQKPRVRLFLTKLFIKDKDLDISLFGSTLHINSIKEIGYYNTYKNISSSIVLRDEVASILNLAFLFQKNDTFIDIGANIGLYSGILSRFQFLDKKMQYYGFEANKDTYQRLLKTIRPYKYKAYNTALSNQKGFLNFSGGAVSGVFGCKSSGTKQSNTTEDISVECDKLDNFEIEGDSLILKIDVEGHESEVLEGGIKLFENKRVKAVYLDGFTNKKIPDFLKNHGFQIFDGRTLRPESKPDFSLLAIHNTYLEP